MPKRKKNQFARIYFDQIFIQARNELVYITLSPVSLMKYPIIATNYDACIIYLHVILVFLLLSLNWYLLIGYQVH